MASKFLLRISDISEKVLQNAVEWCLFELHRMLQCRDNELCIVKVADPDEHCKVYT